ncbi:hypothetical protein FDP41_007792 [Naegleria fowleri]|uniref:Actin-related protein 8 n=1 Tax=Naegleria fowleri TaxID=5763 RepID=A0A6A5C3D8_NAEFO|nr:uncharacterized protein FDP41_007792 [Naegleria fowleri]KAF0983877.1 hypothetical protein FDP41_007792 [Naegleria fowleri]
MSSLSHPHHQGSSSSLHDKEKNNESDHSSKDTSEKETELISTVDPVINEYSNANSMMPSEHEFDVFADHVLESLVQDDDDDEDDNDDNIETIIIDLSSSQEITVGVGGEDIPRCVFNFTSHPNDSLSHLMERVFSEISTRTTLLQEEENKEQPSSCSRAILIIVSPLSSRHLADEDLTVRQEMTEIIFQRRRDVKYLSIQDASYLTSLACSKLSAMVVHLGYETSHVVAIVDGQVRMDSLRVIENGGMSEKKLNEELERRLKLVEGNENLNVTQELLNHVKQSYLKRCKRNVFEQWNGEDQVSCSNDMISFSNIPFGHEMIETTMEDLFFSKQSLHSLSQLISDCISYISDESLDLENNIIVSGNGFIPLIENFHERLSSDLSSLLGHEIVIRHSHSQQVRNLAWIGASILTSVPEWVSPFCVTRESFERDGGSCICTKSNDVIYSSLL